MKNLTLAICTMLMGFGIIHAQNAANQGNSSYTPFHQLLKQNNTGFQNTGGVARSVVDNEIAYRHDKWNAGDWGIIDSGNYAYNTMGNETNGTLYLFATSNNNWINDTNNIYTYDQSGNQLTHIIQSWSPATNSWVNQTNLIFTYNGAGKPLTQTSQIWTDNAWVNIYNFVYSYDANSYPAGQIQQVWSATLNAWVNTQKIIQTNGTNHFVSTEEVQFWDSTSAKWSNYTHTIYSYDQLGNQVRWIEQFWSDSGWFDFYKDSTVYDSNNNVTAIISQQWDTANFVWVNKFMSDYTFDFNNNMVQYGSSVWNTYNAVWTPVFVNNYTYNTSHKVLTQMDADWSATTNSYLNAYQSLYSYDDNNNLVEFRDYYWNYGNWTPNTLFSYTMDANNKTIYELDQVYDPVANAMVNSDQYYYFYTITDGNTGIHAVQNDLGATLYPNPTSGNNINVALTLSENIDITLNTYDVQGKLINSDQRSGYNGANDLQISYPSLSSGTYFIQIVSRSNEKTSLLKFIKN